MASGQTGSGFLKLVGVGLFLALFFGIPMALDWGTEAAWTGIKRQWRVWRTPASWDSDSIKKILDPETSVYPVFSRMWGEPLTEQDKEAMDACFLVGFKREFPGGERELEVAVAGVTKDQEPPYPPRFQAAMSGMRAVGSSCLTQLANRKWPTWDVFTPAYKRSCLIQLGDGNRLGARAEAVCDCIVRESPKSFATPSDAFAASSAPDGSDARKATKALALDCATASSSQ